MEVLMLLENPKKLTVLATVAPALTQGILYTSVCSSKIQNTDAKNNVTDTLGKLDIASFRVSKVKCKKDTAWHLAGPWLRMPRRIFFALNF